MQLDDLALERARGYPFAQSLEAVHLRLHKAATVVAAPLFADAGAQALASRNSFIALLRLCLGWFPQKPERQLPERHEQPWQ